MDPIAPFPSWKRLAWRLALLGPRKLRWKFGVVRWSEALSATPKVVSQEIEDGTQAHLHPVFSGVQKLLAAGIAFPKAFDPLPETLIVGAKSYNRESYWVYDQAELNAWIHVWKSHPDGQKCMDRALAVAAAVAKPDAFRALLEVSPVPSCAARVGQFLFSARDIDRIFKCLEHLQELGKTLDWGEPSFYRTSWKEAPVEAFIRLEKFRIGLPQEWMVELAKVAFDDAFLSFHFNQKNNDTTSAIKTMEWWCNHSLLRSCGSWEKTHSLLLETWLTSIRPGISDEYQRGASMQWEVLCPGSDPASLPPVPKGRASWAHVWLDGIFPAALPLCVVSTVMQHSFSAFVDQAQIQGLHEMWKDTVSDLEGNNLADRDGQQERVAIINAMFDHCLLNASTTQVEPSVMGPSVRQARRL